MELNQLKILHKNHYKHNLPRPAIIGFYCIDKNREYLPTSENLKYIFNYPMNEVEFNLNDGYSSFVPKDEEQLNADKLKFLLTWIDYNNYLDKLSTKEVLSHLFNFNFMLSTVMLIYR